MDDMDDTHEAILSHKCDVRPLCINGRRAACSELRVVRVRVRYGVLVIHRSVLKRDVVMREGVRSAVAIIDRSALFLKKIPKFVRHGSHTLLANHLRG